MTTENASPSSNGAMVQAPDMRRRGVEDCCHVGLVNVLEELDLGRFHDVFPHNPVIPPAEEDDRGCCQMGRVINFAIKYASLDVGRHSGQVLARDAAVIAYSGVGEVSATIGAPSSDGAAVDSGAEANR